MHKSCGDHWCSAMNFRRQWLLSHFHPTSLTVCFIANPNGIIHTVRGFMETSFSLVMLMPCNGNLWMSWKGKWSIVIQKHLSHENKSSRVKTPRSMRIEAVTARVAGYYMDKLLIRWATLPLLVWCICRPPCDLSKIVVFYLNHSFFLCRSSRVWGQELFKCLLIATI